MRKLWDALNVFLRGKLIGFGDIGRHFSKICTETFKKMYLNQNDADNGSEKIKSCFFLSIRYRKTSQTQDVKSQSTERSVPKTAQPKRDSAFEQKTRIGHVERSQQVLKAAFLITTKESSRAELKKTFLEHTQRRFGKFLLCSRNKNFLLNIRYHKTSQTQDGKSQSTNRTLRSLAQPKRDSAFEQKTRIVSCREI